jgi:hypothetical protein
VEDIDTGVDRGQICHCVSEEVASIPPIFVVLDADLLDGLVPVSRMTCYGAVHIVRDGCGRCTSMIGRMLGD